MKTLRNFSVVVSVSFEIPVRKFSDMQIWIDITDHNNFIFLRNLKPYFEKIKSHGTYINI